MRLGISIILVLVMVADVYGQCPPEETLYRRIIYLRDSTRTPFPEQQGELLPILSKIESCPYKNDSTHVLLLGRIAALFFLQGDYIKGIALTKQAMQIVYDNVGKPNINPAALIRSYNNLRICYDALGQRSLKLAAIDSCISISIRLNQGYNFSLALMYYKTVSYMESGDYYRCINYSIFSESVAKNAGYKLDTQTEFATWRINALVLLKKYAEAEKLASYYIDACFKDTALRNVGALYALLGTIKAATGHPEQTLDFYKKSLFYYKLSNNKLGYATTLNNTGDLYFRSLNLPPTALKYYQNALVYAKTADFSANRIAEGMNILNSIAIVFIQRKEYDSAFYYFQKSFDEIHPGINEHDLAKYPDKYLSAELAEYVSSLVLNKADAYLNLYKDSGEGRNLAKAISTYKSIDRLFDRIKFGQTDIESKLFWRSHIRRLYESAIEACYLQNNPAEAFYFFEKSKAVLLQDQLNEQRVLRTDEVMQQTQVTRVINKLVLQIDESESKAVQDSLQGELLKQKQELDRLKELIKEKNQFYYQTVIDTNFLGIADVRKKILADHDALVEMFAGDSAIYVMEIMRDKETFRKVSKTEYDSLLTSFVRFVSDNEFINRNFGSFISVSYGLYKTIFANAALPDGRIIISPDGKYFPFEALVTSTSSGQPVYFIENHAVSYTYSARFLVNDFAGNKTSSARNFMGMAPVQFAQPLRLPGLYGSDESLHRLESHFNRSDNWTSENATRKNFLQNFYRYKIIQLYTHATDSGFNKEPVIYFSDSALLLSDLLYENKPATILIVLSACETGSGKLYEGEGVFGFNRGFAAIGIPSSIANLWQVENISSYKLTELFYQYLLKGLPVDVALQKAKKDFIKSSSKEKQLPYFWAAPVLTGRTDAIVLKRNFTWIYVAGGICLGALVFVFIKRRSVRNLLNNKHES